MDLLNLLLELHSVVRWVIVAVTIVALIWFALVWLRGMRNEKADRGLMAAFTGVIDLQVLLGVIYIIWSGLAGAGFPRYRLEHAVIMIIAAAVAHMSMRWRKSAPQLRARNYVGVIVAVLVLVYIGVSLLPQGWLG